MSSLFRKTALSVACLCFLSPVFAQQEDSLRQTTLQEVVIRAFEQNRKLRDIPAAVNYVGQETLQQYNPSSLVSAVNATPGIHMEERSPGSYRINIRGSSLRSPFGVRNVKVYYNDLPFTDPGGNTYLNAFGYYNIRSIEIIKGPGSSLYGAGTGGVMLLQGIDTAQKKGVQADYSAGSYGLQNINAALITANQSSRNTIDFQHQQSNGYRVHTAMHRDVLNWNGLDKISDRTQLLTTFLYSHLYYETPGALTSSEFKTNPRQARPAAAGFPSAVQMNAHVDQQLFFGGLSLRQSFSDHFSNTSSAYGSYTNFQNPTIRNYSINAEPHTGGRTVFSFKTSAGQTRITIDAGAEYQQNFSTISVYKNKAGSADSMQSMDDVHTRQYFEFLQFSLENNNWLLTASSSLNNMDVNFRHYYPSIFPANQSKNFNNQLEPRFSLTKKFRTFSVYGSFAKGFSPPATTELLPSGSHINLDLEAEQGFNYELGIRGTLLHRLYVDVNGFMFYLNQTIVQRRDLSGGDYYTNSGKTKQRGIDTYISYPVLFSIPSLHNSLLWISHSWHPFFYDQFKQLSTDYSGNHLPGEPLHSVAAGCNLQTEIGLLLAITYSYNSKIPLNDANSAYANAFHLLGTKIAYTLPVTRVGIQVFAGGDNLLNQTYSLGNDINAAGGRYYNAAPGRNFYAGISVHAF